MYDVSNSVSTCACVYDVSADLYIDVAIVVVHLLATATSSACGNASSVWHYVCSVCGIKILVYRR